MALKSTKLKGSLKQNGSKTMTSRTTKRTRTSSAGKKNKSKTTQKYY